MRAPGAVKKGKRDAAPVIGVPPARRGRLLGWWAGRWLSSPGNAVDLVRLTVGRGSWATIGCPWRPAHPSWRSSHPAARAPQLLGVKLVSHVVARACAAIQPTSDVVSTHPDDMRPKLPGTLPARYVALRIHISAQTPG